MILQKVSPVTHSIGNCVKRVVVIVSSVIVFATPVSMLNAVGTAIALSGVFMYSQVKRMQTKKKKKRRYIPGIYLYIYKLLYFTLLYFTPLLSSYCLTSRTVSCS